VRGETRPKELAHAELVGEWLPRLIDEPSEALRLAARAHHLRRWSIPRASHPMGRKGYLQWKQALLERHASEATEILARCGYDDALCERVSRIIRRRNRAGDPEAQALEDALCLVFFETQLAALAAQLETEKLRDVGIKTLRKMSPRGRELIFELPLPEATLELLRELEQSL